MNIPLILGDIRPGAEYGWRGKSYSGGEVANYDNVDWRDEKQAKPTEQELIDAWPAVQKKYFTDVATAETNKAILVSELRAGTVSLATLQEIVADILEGQ
jgi:hypothetical protein